MARRIPPNRLADIARAAAVVFVDKGYKGALMSDVADVLGLSHGLLYRYVESKEALLSLALRYATRPESVDSLTPDSLPLPTPSMHETVEFVTAWLHELGGQPALTTACNLKRASDIRSEFADVVGENYDIVEAIGPVIGLVERCARDLPELHEAWFGRSRRSVQVRMTDYLRQRIEVGQIKPVPDVAVAARLIIETIAWFAWHRKGDPDAASIPDESARMTVIHVLTEAFCSKANDKKPVVPKREARHSVSRSEGS